MWNFDSLVELGFSDLFEWVRFFFLFCNPTLKSLPIIYIFSMSLSLEKDYFFKF